MAKKAIIINLIESDLTLPTHLQKAAELDIKTEGLNTLEVVTLLSSILAQMTVALTNQINSQNTNPLKIVN